MTTKQSIIKALESLPDTTTIEEAMEKLYVLYKVQKGIEQADAGITVSSDQAKKQVQEWLK
ncbi:MAG: hypothetical protein AB9903_24310 [Vulcanimicrobiota bacterium]